MNKLEFILLYLDPGTGSLLVQLIIATVTAAVFFVRGIREKVVNFFNHLRGRDNKES
jgi:hypothetical protein